MKCLEITLSFLLAITFCVNGKINWNEHHDNDKLIDILNHIHHECPNITHIYNLKFENLEKTSLSNKLWVIVFGENPTHHTPLVPEFKYVGNIHGNEVVGRELILRFAHELCQGYLNGDEKTKWIIKNTRIHLLPAMNPDGYQLAIGEGKHDLRGRTNAHNVDLNRNFPDLNRIYFKNIETGINKFDHLLTADILRNKTYQTETWLVMNWIITNNFVLSASMHGGDLVANYPFDTSPDHERTYTKCEDDSTFIQLSNSYSFDNHQMYYGEKKCYDSINHFFHGRTNGARWYPVDGGMQDFNYLASNCFEITLELGCEKYPDGDKLDKFWSMNNNSMYDFLLQVHNGLKGIVIGEDESGEMGPLSGVSIKVVQLNDTSANPIKHNIITTKNGDYFRLLTPGHYIIWAVKSGYKPSISCVNVSEITSLKNLKEAKVMNFVLLLEERESSISDMSTVEKFANDYFNGEYRVSGSIDDPICREISRENMFTEFI